MDFSLVRCFCRQPRNYHCRIVLLDDHDLIQEIQDNTKGQEILDVVFRHLNLIETAYFGLRYLDALNQSHWLDPSKRIVKQLKGTALFSLYFGVKFYAADPCKLLEEITRYQFFLQVKQDILQGRLPVTFDVAAELGAYAVQSELGDFDPRRHSPGYVSEFRFLSNQTAELESKIEDLHKGLIGQLPAAAELSYLDKVKWLEMYGVDLHPVLGEDNVEYYLGLTPSGIIVLRNKNKVGNYYWPRISKIYFKGRYFMIRISDKNNEENTYGFETPSKPACKHLWKCCVEHHAFFRLVQVSNPTPDLFTLGSRFRYSGRTEKQAQADAQMRLRSPPQFARTPSRRYQRRIIEGSADVAKPEETAYRENIPSVMDKKMVSIPLPVTSLYSRSTCSIPATLPSSLGGRGGGAESPRSTRSAPWSQPHVRGLYTATATSPRSVRSAGNNMQIHLPSRGTKQRSSSVDSQSSNDSRSCKRHRRHRSRRGSDNESEMSKGSSRSHRHRRRSHGKRDSESERDHKHHHRHRHKSSSSSRRSRNNSHCELVDSQAQWREVQRRQAEGGTGVHQANVINNKDRRSGYMNSGMETESEMSYHHKRKQRKHRSRSKSPPDTGKNLLPAELKKHLDFNLIDTSGMSETQLREIPYTVVETKGHHHSQHRKHGTSGKGKQLSQQQLGSTMCRKSKSVSEDMDRTSHSMESPPPPYTPVHRDENPSAIPATADLHAKNSINHISSGDSGHFSNTGPGSNSSSTSNSALGDLLGKPLGHGPNNSGSSTHSPANSVGRTRSLDFKSPSLQNITGSYYFGSSYVSSPKIKLPKAGLSPASFGSSYSSLSGSTHFTDNSGRLDTKESYKRMPNGHQSVSGQLKSDYLYGLPPLPNQTSATDRFRNQRLNSERTGRNFNLTGTTHMSFDSSQYRIDNNNLIDVHPFAAFTRAGNITTSNSNNNNNNNNNNHFQTSSIGKSNIRNLRVDNAVSANGNFSRKNANLEENGWDRRRLASNSSRNGRGSFNNKHTKYLGHMHDMDGSASLEFILSPIINSAAITNCSVNDWCADHDSIQEDEEPDEDDVTETSGEKSTLQKRKMNGLGLLHEMSTEL